MKQIITVNQSNAKANIEVSEQMSEQKLCWITLIQNLNLTLTFKIIAYNSNPNPKTLDSLPKVSSTIIASASTVQR